MKWTNKGHEFDELGSRFIGKSIVFYDVAEETYSFCNKLYAIAPSRIRAVVIDNYDKVDYICGAPTISKEEFSKINVGETIVILCCSHLSNYRAQAHKHAINLGYKDGINLFYYDTFEYFYLPIYLFYSCDILYFKSISMVLTTKCNLNCECCLNFTPYNKNKRDFEMDELKKNVDCFFQKVDVVDRFLMSGGEPFLYPNLVELIDYLGEKYRDKTLRFSIVTNGTIIPCIDIINALKRNRVLVQVDDYSRAIGSKSKVEEIKRIFDDNKIKYEIIAVPYWIDMNPTGNTNDQNLEAKMNTCNVPFTGIKNGRLYGCIYNQFAIEAGIIPGNSIEQDSLVISNVVDRAQLLEMQLGYSERGYWEFCANCRGHEWMNSHSALPAKQAEREGF